MINSMVQLAYDLRKQNINPYTVKVIIEFDNPTDECKFKTSIPHLVEPFKLTEPMRCAGISIEFKSHIKPKPQPDFTFWLGADGLLSRNGGIPVRMRACR